MKPNEMRHLQASWVFTSTDSRPLQDHAVILDGGTILDVLPSREAVAKYPDTVPEVYTDSTILPGLVNCHSHTTMPGDGSTVEEAAVRTDSAMLLRSQSNAMRSLISGVTTLTDLGSRNDIVLSLRAALAAGETPGPRMVVAGRAATSPRGHCWQFGGEVADEQELRALARREFALGTDLLKVMATGGGTVGTDPFRPQFTEEIFLAATEEARDAGRPAFAHCSCTVAVRQCIDAGFDVIVHGTFHDEEGNLSGWDPRSAEAALEKGVYWNPTLAVARSGIPIMEAAEEPDWDTIAAKKRVWRERADGVRRLHDMGVPVIAGSDEGWGSYSFGGYILEIEALVEAGIPPEQVLLGATILPSKALRIDGYVGSIESGKRADLLIAEGRPFADVSALRNLQRIILGGFNVSPRNSQSSESIASRSGIPVESYSERWC